MALTSLATSMMLAVLAEIGKTFGVDATGTQSVLTAFFVGFSVGQFVVGPIADRFGRRPVLLGGPILYLAASVLCVLAPSFETLLVARFLQGLGAAAPRVITISVVRDCYSGRRMASVMSLAMTALMVVPVIAPTFGQVVVLARPGAGSSSSSTLYGVVTMAWMYLRLPETLAPDNRRSLQPLAILDAVWQALTTRQTLGYMLATGVRAGLAAGDALCGAAGDGRAARHGQLLHHRLRHRRRGDVVRPVPQFAAGRPVSACGCCRMARSSSARCCRWRCCCWRAPTRSAPISYTAFMCVCNALFMAASSNFNAMAMEPQGRIAGTASSLFGSVTTMMQAMIAHMIGHAYDGTMLPLASGMVACGVTIIVIAAITERGKLFGK